MARSGRDKNYVSFWFWFLAPLVLVIPCIGLVMIIIWAFVGENESRKNYYRAMIAWILISLVLSVILTSLPFWPAIVHQFQTWLSRFNH